MAKQAGTASTALQPGLAVKSFVTNAQSSAHGIREERFAMVVSTKDFASPEVVMEEMPAAVAMAAAVVTCAFTTIA
jgi:hypothetical protein